MNSREWTWLRQHLTEQAFTERGGWLGAEASDQADDNPPDLKRGQGPNALEGRVGRFEVPAALGVQP